MYFCDLLCRDLIDYFPVLFIDVATTSEMRGYGFLPVWYIDEVAF
ncbi:hypothetical protein VH1709_contig00191-0001 [Vibrio harveyi]|nr:hypothetical protein VH1709_contig00191-0001 [Vibrio harveyi]